MKRTFRSVLAGASVLAITGGVLAASVGSAAAATPTWEPSDGAIGTLAFYNSSGTQVTSGNNLNHLFDYALASSADPSTHPGNTANLEFANPTPGEDALLWPNTADESSSYPNSSAPGSLATATNPLVTLDSNGANLNAAASGFTANTASGYVNVYQIRVYTTGAGGTGTGSSKYWDADVMINGTSWTELYGTAVSTSSTLVANPSPATQGQSVTFTDTITEADGTTAAGTVQFKVAGANYGSPVTVNSSGVATTTDSALTSSGSPYALSAVFTPSGSTYASSTANTSLTVNPPATTTTTTLTISGNTTTGTDATLSGTVSPSAAAGTVSFYDNGSTTALNSSPVTVTSGAYSYTLTGGFSQGSHSVVAKFTPTNPANYAASQSSAQTFYTNQGSAAGSTCTQTGSNCTDVQNIQGEIPTGTLVISTPYTSSNPLDVGKLALNTAGTEWTGSAPFDCIIVTDASSGGSPFVASALASTLTQVSGTGNSAQNTANAYTTINGENVGLTGLAKSTDASCAQTGTAPVNTYTGTVTAASNPAADPAVVPTDTGDLGLGKAPHQILQGTSGGVGTATYDGLLTLNAPTATAAGTYAGTVTFTVTD